MYLYITCNKKTLFVKKYLSLLWISRYYGPFSLGAHFETCEPFISLIFQIFSGLQLTMDNWNRGYWIRRYRGPPVLKSISELCDRCNDIKHHVAETVIKDIQEVGGFMWPGIRRSGWLLWTQYRGAEKSLARPGRKQANVSVRMAWISFGTLPCRKRNLMTARVSILLKSHVSLTCFRACFLHGQAKDFSTMSVMNLRVIFLCRKFLDYLRK